MQVPTVFNELWIQGRSDKDYWVETFELLYRDNDTTTWTTYNSSLGEMVFDANNDSDTITVFEIEPAIRAQIVRIHPISWHGAIGLRFEMFGCSQEEQHYSKSYY